MLTDFLTNEYQQSAINFVAYAAGGALVLFIAYEWLFLRGRDGKKTKQDWAMAGIALTFLSMVQRPLLLLVIFLALSAIAPAYSGALQWMDAQYFWPCLVVYLLIDEYLHGRVHLFAHSRRPKNPWLQKIQAFYKVAHRPHHQTGGNDGRGELSVTQTYVEHWGWWLVLPNYWFGLICLYFGFYQVFIWGSLSKTLWGMHVHTNWGYSYDLYLLNHPNPWIHKPFHALCHILVFPNMHHQHHSRSANSAKNMTNFIALFDWLLWDTQVIEKERPKIYGWRQTPEEEFNPWYRYFNTNLNRAGPVKLNPKQGETAEKPTQQLRAT
ncbi:MAG: sterol desaturase [Gammaproteobacteria bacterium]|nr:MAG: sterol desaturase [Gammaproteobacteria bacterium]RLA44195.1 MAG: sterol desaturase [Gammaproteobacteria bacterium]